MTVSALEGTFQSLIDLFTKQIQVCEAFSELLQDEEQSLQNIELDVIEQNTFHKSEYVKILKSMENKRQNLLKKALYFLEIPYSDRPLTLSEFTTVCEQRDVQQKFKGWVNFLEVGNSLQFHFQNLKYKIAANKNIIESCLENFKGSYDILVKNNTSVSTYGKNGKTKLSYSGTRTGKMSSLTVKV